jgi:hypothetical protein
MPPVLGLAGGIILFRVRHVSPAAVLAALALTGRYVQQSERYRQGTITMQSEELPNPLDAVAEAPPCCVKREPVTKQRLLEQRRKLRTVKAADLRNAGCCVVGKAK